jgi:hypothetical protein
MGALFHFRISFSMNALFVKLGFASRLPKMWGVIAENGEFCAV